MPRIRWLLLVVVLGPAFLGGASRARAATWGPPAALSPDVPGNPKPLIAVNAHGDAVVSWSDGALYINESMADAYRQAGGRFTSREAVTTAGRGEFIPPAPPAIAPGGTVTLGWIRHPNVNSVQRHPGGGFTPIAYALARRTGVGTRLYAVPIRP